MDDINKAREALIFDIMWQISNVHDLRDQDVRAPIERAVRTALSALDLSAIEAEEWRTDPRPHDQTILIAVERTNGQPMLGNQMRITYPTYVDQIGRLCNTGTCTPEPGFESKNFRAVAWRPLPSPPEPQTVPLYALVPDEVSGVVERLLQNHAQLGRMTNQASFLTDGMVRVKDPAAIMADLRDAASALTALVARAEGLLSVIETQEDSIAKLERKVQHWQECAEKAGNAIACYESGLRTLSTTFYKDDQHQDYAKHVLASGGRFIEEPK